MSTKAALWRGVKIALGIAPVAVLVFDNVGSIAAIKGRSMQPTFNANGLSSDHVWVSKLGIGYHNHTRGDIVAVRLSFRYHNMLNLQRSPDEPNKLYVKRMIALPGDRVRTLDSDVIQIPDGHCWIEGDNYRRSKDSNTFGPVCHFCINVS